MAQPVVGQAGFEADVFHCAVVHPGHVKSGRGVESLIGQQVGAVAAIHLQASVQPVPQGEVHAEVESRGLFPAQQAVGRREDVGDLCIGHT